METADKESRPEVLADGGGSEKQAEPASDSSIARVKSLGVSIKTMTDDAATVAGYGVIWGSPEDRDLEGDYFTPETDFWLDKLEGARPVLYEHGMEPGIGKTMIGKTSAMKPDDVGLWVEAQLDRHEKYVNAVLELAEMGVLGWSSAAVGHLIEAQGGQIKSWPLAEMTLTVEPAEPRLLGVSELRSLSAYFAEAADLIPKGEEESPEEVVEVDVEVISAEHENEDTEKVEMDKEKETETILDPGVVEAIEKAYDRLGVDLTKSLNDAFEQIIQRLDDVGPKASHAVEDDGHDGKSFGDFLIAMRSGNTKRLSEVYDAYRVIDDESGKSVKAAMAEGSGITGGYLVPEEFESNLLRLVWEESVVRQAGATVFPMGRRSLTIPALNVTASTTAGETSQYGGVTMSWKAEAATIGETEPNFKEIELVAHKLCGYSLVSNELLDDSAIALESLLYNLYAGAIAWAEDYAFLRGTGTAQPLGIATFCTTNISSMPAKTTASRFKLTDAGNMIKLLMPGAYGRSVWLMSQSFIPELIRMSSAPEVTTSGGAVMIWQPDARQGQVFPLSLYGRPVYITEKLPAINNDNSVLLCDMRAYVIGDRKGVEIDFSPHYKFVNDQGTWRVKKRVDGQPWVDGLVTLSDGSTKVSPFVTINY